MRRAIALLFFVGCTHAPPDATPEGAVREWLSHMEGSIDDSRETKAAYDLLGPSARANLEDRAKRASQVEGRRVEPYEMIAEGHFGLRFRPQKMKASLDGDGALVLVTGTDPVERAEIRCVKEGSGWRVEPVLPEPQTLPKRDAG
jgi:hypothetical protein